VNKLRYEDKVDAILLLTHFGPKCDNDEQEKQKQLMQEKFFHKKRLPNGSRFL